MQVSLEVPDATDEDEVVALYRPGAAGPVIPVNPRYIPVTKLMSARSVKAVLVRGVLFSSMAMIASCASQPGPEAARISSYGNIHHVQFQYPSSWQLEDMSKSYGSLDEAEKEGASYIQVYSYDPMGVQDPAEAVSPGRIKIAILFKRNLDNLDYSRVLARFEKRMLEKTVFRVNGRDAYKITYWITSEETGERLKVLSIEYLDQDLYVRFLCYPWNSVHQKEFEALARSFRYKGR